MGKTKIRDECDKLDVLLNFIYYNKISLNFTVLLLYFKYCVIIVFGKKDYLYNIKRLERERKYIFV